MRDSQRSRVFASQQVLEHRLFNGPNEASEWLTETIERSRFWTTRFKSRWGHSSYPIEIDHVHKAVCSATTSPFHRAVIVEYDDSTSDIDLLHAIAHLVTDVAPDQPRHGPAFALAMLTVVRRYRGENDYRTLRSEYLRQHVKTRSYSPQARAQAKERYLEQQIERAPDQLAAMINELEADIQSND